MDSLWYSIVLTEDIIRHIDILITAHTDIIGDILMPKLEGNTDTIKFVVNGLRYTEMIRESHNVLTIREEMMDYEAIERCLEITNPMHPIPKEVMSHGIQEHVPIVPTVKLPVEQRLIDQRRYKQGRYVKMTQDHQVTEVLPNGHQR